MPQYVTGFTALLADDQYRHNATRDVGTHAIVTYSFPSGANLPKPSDLAFSSSDTRALSNAERAVARRALEEFSRASGLEFVEVNGSAELNFVEVFNSNYGGWAEYPTAQNNAQDVVVDTTRQQIVYGTYRYEVLLHEIGHAVGLKHPHDGAIRLTDAADTESNTLMTYNDEPQFNTLGPLDIQAIQHLYGPASTDRDLDISYDAATDTVIVLGTGASEQIYGPSEKTVIAGGGGNDLIRADEYTTANDTLRGNRGNDTIEGNRGHDLIESGPGADRASGGYGRDTLLGARGRDVLNGNQDADRIEGGYGADSILGGSGNDTIIGSRGNDTLRGESQHDLIEGGDGRDLIHGGIGNDSLYGGAGADTLHGDGMSGGRDHIEGGSGADRINGDRGTDSLYGNSGRDRIDGGDNHDVIEAGSGTDTVFGGSGNDQIFGNRHSDSLVGEDGDDTLVGGAGNDTLRGLDDSDVFEGGDGNDLIIASDGGSRSHPDRIVFAAGDDVDTIRDFGVDADTVELVDIAITRSEALAALVQRGNDTVLDLPGTDRIIFKNTDADDFDLANFV